MPCWWAATPIPGYRAATCVRPSGIPSRFGTGCCGTPGGLARRDVTLLASCSDQGAQVAAGDVDGPASRVELARAVGELVNGPR